jgi:vacuolar protein sorting-associated protein 13A/C
MTETQVTIVNDLQGLDEALFRISASNFVAGAEVNQGVVVSSGSMNETTFSIQVNTAIMADYFDPSLQLWVVLLKRPWEVTLKSSREAGHRSSSERMSTVVDIEAYPCLLSFSEQFLVSIGAASRMWSIYLMATTTAIEGDKKQSFDMKEGEQRISKKSLAATAARNLITSLPYAVENHSGLDIHFMLPCSGEYRSCQSGTLQYFRFEPPQGRGSGGNRRYGQDITRLKALNLFVSGKTIAIENIDAELSRPRHVHVLGEGRYLVTRASKEGKTKVSCFESMLT